MYSIYYCQKCSIDFPSVTRYVKHRKFFCKLGRDDGNLLKEDDIPEDGIGKLTIAEASRRISRAIELRTKEVDPAVYSVVEQVRLYKKKRRNDGKKINEKRDEVLKKVSLLKQELKDLEKNFSEKNKKYESIKAYSKVSAIEITGTEELIDELHDLKNAIVYLEDEIAANIDFLHCIETGNYKPGLQKPASAEKPASDKVLTSKAGSGEKHTQNPSTRENNTRRHGTRERIYPNTRERIQLPALPVKTPILTPVTRGVTAAVTRDVTPALTRGVTTAESGVNCVTEIDGVHFRATSAPRVSVTQTAHSQDAGVVSVQTLKPGSADSTVLLNKLQRKRDIILLQREVVKHGMSQYKDYYLHIRAMELEEGGVVKEDVLSDSSLIPYMPNFGVAIYIDYLTPTFHIPANILFTVLRDAVVISQSATFIITPATHLTFLGYHEIFPNIPPSNDIYLHCSIRTLEGEELGWCLFNIFSERELNSGAWRLPLKSPPFSQDLVSSLYHGVRSLNYSLRLRCSVATVHEAMLIASKLKLAQYKLHNPVFQDNRILRNNLEKKQKLQRNPSEEKVTETYGPQDDFDPIKVLRKSVMSKSTPIRPMPAPSKTTTPAQNKPTEVPKRIKGLHYHTLQLHLPSLPPSLSVQTEYCEVDEEFNVRNISPLPSSTANLTTQLHRYFLDYQTLELAWNPEEILLLFSFKKNGGSVVGWSCTLYSDKKTELEIFKPPLPSFLQLAQWLEREEAGETTEENFTKLSNCSFRVRYFDSRENVARFPERPEEDSKLPQPRIPTGAFRHVDQEPNFVVHDKEKSLTLVIDGARYLPSCVTISRVTGRIFDRDFNIVGPQISSSVVVDSDIYNPIYKYSVDIPGDVPSNAVVVLKLYSLHAITGQLTTIGYSLLNLFCKRGTVMGADSTDSSVVINSGAWQLPLYIDGPDAGQPLTAESLKEVYCIPCSWLLVRLMYRTDDGSIPLMPSYNDGVYSDNHPNLSVTEMFLLDSYKKRPIKNGREACNFSPTPATLIKKLTRHKGQTVRDMSPAEIVEYSPEFGVGVKIVGIKNLGSRDSDSTMLVYLRLSTRDTLLRFTDHVVYNESVQFNIGHKIKWRDQIHVFKHVIPSPDVFILVQVVEHSSEQFKMMGWLTIPIFCHTGPATYVNRTHRSEIPIIPGSLDLSKLSLSADLKSELEMEGETPFAVLEVFDARFSSESRTVTYEVDPDYMQLAEEGVKFIASQMSEATEFVGAFVR